jgi:hypothetical protein
VIRVFARPGEEQALTVRKHIRSLARGLARLVAGGACAVGCYRPVVDYACSIEGTVIDDTGAPIPGAILRLEVTGTAAGQRVVYGTQAATTDDAGAFRLFYLTGREGRLEHTLRASKPGYTSRELAAKFCPQSPHAITLARDAAP